MAAARQVKKEEVEEEEQKEEDDADSEVSPGGSSSTESSQPGEASTSQMDAAREVEKEEVEEEEQKEEDDADSEGRHSHQFTVKFPNKDKKYLIHCQQPRTVLDAIESRLKDEFKKKSISVSKIIIQRSNESVIATHFPCSCIDDQECLVVHCRTGEVQETKRQHDRILPRDEYSVFYISKRGGENMIAEKLLRSNPLSKIDFLCVYAKKGTSVKEALKQDGRFVDLGDFELTEVEKSDTRIDCKLNVDNLHDKKFKICRDRKSPNYANEEASSEQQEHQGQPSTSKQSKQKVDPKSVLAEAQKSRISVKRAMEEKGREGNTEEIYKLLCEQFPDLKTWMESTSDSYQKALELKKENFGKIQQSFSEVHRLKKLLKLGESVCKVIVSGVCQGTGFVLFDRLILTNAHLFKKCVKEKELQEDCIKGYKLQEGIDVYALFNYDEPEPLINYHAFTAKKTFIDLDWELDYAILELNPEGRKQNQTAETGKAKVPPGLLSKFAPPPDNGEACLIGHPAGEVKQIDPTCIIPMEKRVEAMDEHLHPYQNTLFIVQSIIHVAKQKGIESIMMGGSKAEKVVTYNTFMYHGASGSPVFDAQCRVFGLHTAGYAYGFPKETESVIEFAHPLLTIFEKFVGNLKKNGKEELLERIQKEAKKNKNSDLENIIKRLNEEETETD